MTPKTPEQMDSNIKDGNFSIMIQKANPKPDPISYEFVTVSDIFNAMTKDNVDKFCKEFKQGLKAGIASRELIKELAKENGVEVGNEILQMPSLTWIDD